MSQLAIESLGAAAAICSTTSFTPQLIKLVREKTAEALSLRMYLLTVTGFALWTGYGLMLRSLPLVASNLISLGLSTAILVLTLRYRDRSPDDGEAAQPGG
jgi:MtN3 and saliva related transmembrane protein